MSADRGSLASLTTAELQARRDQVASEIDRLTHDLWKIDTVFRERELKAALTPPWEKAEAEIHAAQEVAR